MRVSFSSMGCCYMDFAFLYVQAMFQLFVETWMVPGRGVLMTLIPARQHQVKSFLFVQYFLTRYLQNE